MRKAVGKAVLATIGWLALVGSLGFSLALGSVMLATGDAIGLGVLCGAVVIAIANGVVLDTATDLWSIVMDLYKNHKNRRG